MKTPSKFQIGVNSTVDSNRNNLEFGRKNFLFLFLIFCSDQKLYFSSTNWHTGHPNFKRKQIRILWLLWIDVQLENPMHKYSNPNASIALQVPILDPFFTFKIKRKKNKNNNVWWHIMWWLGTQWIKAGARKTTRNTTVVDLSPLSSLGFHSLSAKGYFLALLSSHF